MQVRTSYNTIHFNGNFQVSIQRTLRVPDTAKTYKLPASLGSFRVHQVQDFMDNPYVPDKWKQAKGVFIMMYENEAAWLNFSGQHPHALKVAFGKVNAINGEIWNQKLIAGKNDYIVAPRPQYWIDGINVGDGVVRQIVASRLGEGKTIEEQVTGKAEHGGMQLIVYAPKKEYRDQLWAERLRKINNDYNGMWESVMSYGSANTSLQSYSLNSTASPRNIRSKGLSSSSPDNRTFFSDDMSESLSEMGVSAGGKIQQKIYPDPHGVHVWDQDNFGRVFVHIASPELYEKIIGQRSHSAPTRSTYSQYNIPWFELKDNHMGDIEASDTLKKVKSVGQLNMDEGINSDKDHYMDSNPSSLPHPDNILQDGDW